MDIADKMDIGFRDLGERSLKNISRLVRAFAVPVDAPARPAATPERPINRRWPFWPSFRGRATSAIENAEEALRLNPRDPLAYRPNPESGMRRPREQRRAIRAVKTGLHDPLFDGLAAAGIPE